MSGRYLPSPSHTNIAYIVTTIAIVLLGFYIRARGLGDAPFTIDEYYIATSANNIIEKGLPVFNCGGVYTRGLAYQYILSFLFDCGVNDELYARSVTVASNLVAALGLYVFAKQIAGRAIAFPVLILFIFSIWEIEFSRFTRMYAPFQMIFIWYLYHLFKWAHLNQEKSKHWCYTLSFLSIFIYEGGIFLTILNLLPWLINNRAHTIRNAVTSLTIITLSALYITADFAFISQATPGNLINHSSEMGSSVINLPPILLPALFSNMPAAILFLIILSYLLFTATLKIRRLINTQTDDGYAPIIGKIIIITTAVAFSILNAYIMLFCVVVIALSLNLTNIKNFTSKYNQQFVVALGAMLVFWLTYSAVINYAAFSNENDYKQILIEAINTLFRYPYIYDKFFAVFFDTLPFFTITTTLILLIAFIKAILYRSSSPAFLFIFSIFIILIVGICVLYQPYISTRYFFFLYPIILLMVTLSIFNILREINGSAANYSVVPVLIFMIFSEDYNLNHYKNINKNEILYRINYDETMTDHLYSRWDYRGPAEFINSNKQSNDIVIATTYATPYYLEQLDYFYHDRGRDNFKNGVGCNGEKSKWTNAKLISLPEELLETIRNTNTTIWLIAQSEQYKWRAPIEAEISADFSKNIVYKSVDGNLNVYKFPQQTAP